MRKTNNLYFVIAQYILLLIKGRNEEREFKVNTGTDYKLEEVKDLLKKQLKAVQPRHGMGCFKDLFWWQLEIKPKMLKGKYQNYNSILLMPYAVTLNDIYKLTVSKEENIDKISIHIEDNNIIVQVHDDRRGNKEYKSNIDFITGNIHVEFDIEKWFKNPCIKQVILAKGINHPGPNILRDLDKLKRQEIKNSITDAFIFKNKRSTIIIPKKCYFPSIEDNNNNEANYSVEELLDGLIENITLE